MFENLKSLRLSFRQKVLKIDQLYLFHLNRRDICISADLYFSARRKQCLSFYKIPCSSHRSRFLNLEVCTRWVMRLKSFHRMPSLSER